MAIQATDRLGSSIAFTRSWTRDDSVTLARDRRELSGGVSYLVAPRVAVFGSLGQTVATTDDSGAGVTISGGVTFLLNSRAAK